MYVGPWQEYKLMKVIADMQNERDRLQEEMENMSCNPEEYFVSKHDVSNNYINNDDHDNGNSTYCTNNDYSNSSVQESYPYSVSEYGVDCHTKYKPEPRLVHHRHVDGLLVHLDRRHHIDIAQHAFDTYPPGHYCAPRYKHATPASQRAMQEEGVLCSSSSSSTTPWETGTGQHNLTREQRAVLALMPQRPIHENNVCVKPSLDLDSIARLASQKVFEQRVRGPVQRGVFYVAPQQSSALCNSSIVSSSTSSSLSSSSINQSGNNQYNDKNCEAKSNVCNAMQNVNLQKRAICNAKNKMQERIERRKKLQALYTGEMESEDREVEQHTANCTTANNDNMTSNNFIDSNVERKDDIISNNVFVDDKLNNNNNVESNGKNRDVHELEEDEVDELMTWADMLDIDQIDAM